MNISRNASSPTSVSQSNKIMLRFFLLLLSLPALALAQEPQERTFGNGTLPEHLALYDADDSGSLSQEELQVLREDRLQRQQRLRNRWDTDRDGKISDQEREAAKITIRNTIEARRLLRFNEVDLDRNGQLTLTEFLNITAVSAADTNTPGVAQRIFTSLDLDKNDTVSAREFLLKLDTLPPEPVDAPLINEHPKTPLPVAPARQR